VRRYRTPTLARLKEEARVALRDLLREGKPAGEVASIAERLAPTDEDELFSLARHSPTLRPDVRAGVVAALNRVLDDELRAIREGGAEYLELQDKKGCCGS